jgi:hypothetical protein|tara:strand:+ start:116 stop:547 length:432 start_codon:yes stop_codon:yes gene_type:complete
MRNLILILLLATTNLFAQKWEFKKNKDYQVAEAVNLTNEVRNQAMLKPITLSKRLSNLASSRLDSVRINGNYTASLDETGEIYFYTEKDFKNYYYNAVIGLIIPGKNNFTYDQITCADCKEIGFASKTISGTVWTMMVFDTLY